MDRERGSCSSHFRRSFDVFLSFRGEDTRSNFTSHLNMKLRQRGINVFIDDKLSRGEEISTSLLEAIEESKMSIVIISENYASSSWCLNELEKIIDERSNNSSVVLPVFYKVDASQVRNQSGAFGEEFAKLEVRFSIKKMQAWRNALTTISNLSGWVLKQGDVEANLVEEIAQKVGKTLNAKVAWNVAKFPVGIDRQVMNLLSHIMIDEIKMVGLYGIGGIGKTTLAKALYNRIAGDFQGCCFLENIRSEASSKGLVNLQQQLLSEILMDDFIKVRNLHQGINIIWDRLHSIKILLILDDVDQSEQLEALAGGHDWFGRGSKIIVTTRNNHLIDSHDHSNLLQSVDGLNTEEALKLFSWHAFNNEHPSPDVLIHSERAVNYCKGLPLALQVLGEFLRSREQSKFKSILDDFENSYLDKGIHGILKISYDGLEEDVKEIFLDISCCFVQEDINEVKMKLEACGHLGVEKGMTKLMDLSLLTVDKQFNLVEMHDLIQQMGHTIHLSETSKSHRRKRFLVKSDVLDVLNGDKEARAVKVIKLNFNKPTELDIDSRGFEKVKNLVVLDVRNATSSKSLEYLPGNIRWINWHRFPFPSLPSSYSGENLIELKLPWSSIKHFGKGVLMNCKWLKHMDLSFSIFLEEIPNLSAAMNLEELDLCGCTNLVKVHESVGSLGKLTELTVSSHYNGFKQFPRNLKLKSLKKFEIIECRVVEGCPHFSKEMKSNLEELTIYGTIITELSPTIGYLIGLKKFSIIGCEVLTTLPSTIKCLSNLTSLAVCYTDLSTFSSLNPYSVSLFPYLTNLNLNCCKIRNLSFLETMSHVAPALRELDLADNKFSSLPSCIVNFKSLRFLDICDCELLEEISKVPEGAIYMNAGGCKSLARFPDNIFEFISCDSEYVDGTFKQLMLMNCEIPEWFKYKSTKNFLVFSMPFINPGRRWKVFAPCVKFQVDHSTPPKIGAAIVQCQVFINYIQVWHSNYGEFSTQSRIMHCIYHSTIEYMWLIVLNPHRDFHPNWDEMMETSQEIDLNKPYLGNNSMEIGASMDRKKFSVLFRLHPNCTDYMISVKRCGVHIIMDE